MTISRVKGMSRLNDDTMDSTLESKLCSKDNHMTDSSTTLSLITPILPRFFDSKKYGEVFDFPKEYKHIRSLLTLQSNFDLQTDLLDKLNSWHLDDSITYAFRKSFKYYHLYCK